MYIGKKLKELRKLKGLTLVELSKMSGVQVATLSRIENLKMTGTLESHIAIANTLGIDVTQLYTEIVPEADKATVMEENNNNDIFSHNDQSSYEILTRNILRKRMMPMLQRIEINGKTNVEQNRSGSEKFIYLLEGKIEAIIGEEAYILSKGKSLYFDSSLKHHFINKSNEVARMLIIVTPVEL